MLQVFSWGSKEKNLLLTTLVKENGYVSGSKGKIEYF